MLRWRKKERASFDHPSYIRKEQILCPEKVKVIISPQIDEKEIPRRMRAIPHRKEE